MSAWFSKNDSTWYWRGRLGRAAAQFFYVLSKRDHCKLDAFAESEIWVKGRLYFFYRDAVSDGEGDFHQKLSSFWLKNAGSNMEKAIKVFSK